MKTANDKRIWDEALMQRACLLNRRGYTPKEVQGHMLDEGHDIPWHTIRTWIYGGARQQRVGDFNGEKIKKAR